MPTTPHPDLDALRALPDSAFLEEVNKITHAQIAAGLQVPLCFLYPEREAECQCKRHHAEPAPFSANDFVVPTR